MDAGLVDAVMTQLTLALGVVGQKVLSSAEDEAADETVRLGQRLLARLRRSASDDPARPQLESAAADVAANPDDEDFRAALRGQLKKALSGADGMNDPALAEDLLGLLRDAGVSVAATGQGSVAVGRNEGIVSTGDHATNTINQDVRR